ncbi:MAG: serine/threonine-protein kinase [Polyangiaceae bacterium]
MSFTTDPRLLALRDKLPGQVLRGSNGVQYHLRDRIGEGGQGWVFTANWDEPGGFVVIVKVLRPDAVSGDALRRFQREAEVLRMLSQQPRPNPNIVRFFDHAVAHMPSPVGGDPLILPFTVLEYVNGLTLEQVLDTTRGRGLPVERVRRIVRQVCQALELVHAQNIVHRDLKPSNILLATEAGAEVAKVTDFGLVKLVEVNLQRTTSLAGASLGYAPPEQYEQGNQRVSVRTDVFSLAAITIELLTGKYAFPFRDGENPLLIVTRILNGPRPSLAQNLGAVSAELQGRSDLIEQLDVQFARALSPDPKDRHPSVADFWGKVEPILRAAAESAGARLSGAPAAVPSQLPFLATVPAYPAGARMPTRQSGLPSIEPPPAPPREETSGSFPVPANRSPSDTRPRHAESDAGRPAAWTWRVTTRSIQPGIVVAASFSPDGQSAIGVGPTGLARWERGAWVGIALPSVVDTRLVRGLRRVRNGDVVLVGERALAVRIAPSGANEVWHVPDREATFHMAFVDDRTGTVTLGGDRPGRASTRGATVGTLVQLVEGRVVFASDVAGTLRLRAAARVVSGSILACGDFGALARLEAGNAEHVGSLCGGHLLAIEALPDGGAVTVGAGGHALYLSPRLEPHLEAVQTTRDLLSLSVADDGSAWAGAAQARLLRRTGESWVRMSGDLGLLAGVIAVWAGSRFVRAVCDDGAVIEGQLA